MKHLLLFLLLSLPFLSIGQNNAPVAVNDTFYVDYNDTLDGYIVSINLGNFSSFGPNFLQNDSDPNAEQFYMDTAFYNGLGTFSSNSYQVSANYYRTDMIYIPPINFIGVDSIRYVIKDVGTPTMYDSAWVYLNIKYPEAEYLNINNVSAPIGLHNLFNDFNNSVANYNVPKQKAPGDPYYTTIYAANLWVAGKVLDSAYASSETFGSLLAQNNDYDYFISRSGPIMDSVHYKLGKYDYDWDRLWKVNASDIIYHQNNYMNPGYQPIEVIKNWPGNGDVSKGQANQLAPFYDNDNDAFYDPMAGDYPLIKGSQAVYHIYNDERLIPGSGGQMSLEVHCMAYAYNCPQDSALNNTIFLDYTIYNRSLNTYDSSYVGMWVDFDIGGAMDDISGSNIDKGSFYAYNADSIDEGGNGVFGYQSHPPSQGVTFLEGVYQDPDGVDNSFGIAPYESVNGFGFGDGVLDNERWGFEHFIAPGIGGGQHPGDGDPQSQADYYNYLRGHWRDGTQIHYGGCGHPSCGGTIPAKYLFPGDSDSLWYNTGGISQAPWFHSGLSADTRGVGSSGPHTWSPGGILNLSLAFVFGRDYQNTGNLAGVAVMQERIDSIRSYHKNGFLTTACGLTLSLNEDELPQNDLAIYPNPFNENITVEYELENGNGELRVISLVGQVIKTQVVTSNRTSLDLSELSNGIYFVQIKDGSKMLTKKVLKH